MRQQIPPTVANVEDGHDVTLNGEKNALAL
jgi:hypothetical protein